MTCLQWWRAPHSGAMQRRRAAAPLHGGETHSRARACIVRRSMDGEDDDRQSDNAHGGRHGRPADTRARSRRPGAGVQRLCIDHQYPSRHAGSGHGGHRQGSGGTRGDAQTRRDLNGRAYARHGWHRGNAAHLQRENRQPLPSLVPSSDNPHNVRSGRVCDVGHSRRRQRLSAQRHGTRIAAELDTHRPRRQCHHCPDRDETVA